MNIGPLMAEMGSGVWGSPANFNGFRVLASLLHRHRWTEVNQTLQDVWHVGCLLGCYTLCIRLFFVLFLGGALAPNGILPGAKFTLRPSLALSRITARHSSSGRQPNFAAWYLHATGRPSLSTLGGQTSNCLVLYGVHCMITHAA